MRQDVNYIKHHKNVNIKISQITTTKITSTDISLYNALFLIWNECGFETELSINRNDVMMLSKIGSANTYTNSLKKLDKLKFLKYKPSYNPLIGSRIEIYRFDKGCDNSTDKGCDNSSVTSSSKGTDKGSDTLYKHLNKETIKLLNNKTYSALVNKNLKNWLGLESEVLKAEIYPTFKDFWNLYDKKLGSIKKIEPKFNKLPQETKEFIMAYIPKYKISQPDKQYRKHPETFLNNESWNDELIINNNNNGKQQNTDYREVAERAYNSELANLYQPK